MRTPSTRVIVLILAGLVLVGLGAVRGGQGGELEVYFSPKGGCTDAIVREIRSAKSTLAIQAYTFTSSAIADAVAAARARGVEVVVVLDASNETDRDSKATFLMSHGIRLLVDRQHNIAHNKVMVIDGTTVITGSFNFTRSAEIDNAENLLVIHRPELAQEYLKNVEEHAAHSKAFERR